MTDTTLRIGQYEFTSRFLIGTGKFRDLEIQRAAVTISEAQIITFAVRRLNLEKVNEPTFLESLDLSAYTLLPNTAGATTAEEAVRIARLAKASGLCDMIKVEVIADQKTLLPDPIETLRASALLVEEGFTVLTYTNDDPILARKLQEVGVHAVMPGASPIGSGQGILNPLHLSIMMEEATVPIIVDAGIGSPSDATQAMELGADGVLLNTAVALANDPVRMAEAMKLGIQAGRKGFLAGRIPRKHYASASSPKEGMLT
ncbi:thiazole synthase [Brevibacillus laterosporus]|uniref:thiazole synthase n=1 Tax=Brevibacillus laterosporus TaxID=1465 RepID=UPI000E6D5382|nr:thiazole synthase [Brevibacillus laterosporus]AYB37746.1 thiazole synthase [Brevibacillus laterosporus]MBM7108357.1 Thiazole synthase [Brevibacillus laterosporus]NKQ18958.1 thiazole synthase [Brevibacillus laterosporus]WNX29514.1 thiazole synthase [Brevibacillus laterosporus]